MPSPSATTVRVDRKVKQRLDRLQRRLQSSTGRAVSHNDLLDQLVRFADERAGEFLEESGAPWTPPSRANLDRILAQVEDWGVETDSRNIDRDLTGGANP